MMLDHLSRKATLYRMVMDKHTCPYGLKTKDLLQREGYTVDDRWLTTREETDAFKAEHNVKTTPQTFINGVRIGGYDDVRQHLGKPVRDPKAVTYRPVIAVFAVTAFSQLGLVTQADFSFRERPQADERSRPMITKFTGMIPTGIASARAGFVGVLAC